MHDAIIFTQLVAAAHVLLEALSYHMETVELCDQHDNEHGVDYHQHMVNVTWKQYKALFPIMENRRSAGAELGSTNRWREVIKLEDRLGQDLAMGSDGNWYYVLDSFDPFDNGIRDTDYLDPTTEGLELEDDIPF